MGLFSWKDDSRDFYLGLEEREFIDRMHRQMLKCNMTKRQLFQAQVPIYSTPMDLSHIDTSSLRGEGKRVIKETVLQKLRRETKEYINGNKG